MAGGNNGVDNFPVGYFYKSERDSTIEIQTPR